MLNQFVVVGKILTMPRKLIGLEEGEYCFEVVVPRAGTSNTTDRIACITTENIATNMNNYTKLQDIVGVKGSIRTINDTMYVFAEKITFLSTHREDDIEGGE
jgi:hypothetical protein